MYLKFCSLLLQGTEMFSNVLVDSIISEIPDLTGNVVHMGGRQLRVIKGQTIPPHTNYANK